MKDQFVIAYLADFSMTEAVVSHACQLARMLHKGLILLYVEDSRYKHLPTTAEAEQTLMQIEASHADLKPAHVALKGDTREVINISEVNAKLETLVAEGYELNKKIEEIINNL